MANNVIKRIWNQNTLVNIEALKGAIFEDEDGGHTFEISGVDNSGNAISLSGTVAGVFLRPDNTDVPITGSASGGIVSVTLPAECYDVPGRFGLTVFVTADSQKTCVYAAIGTVGRTSSGSVAPGTSADVVDLINQISAAVATIPASWSGLMADIAPTYSTSAAYPVGAYVYYNGDLYRCTTAITTGETWTAAHWTTSVLGNDVSDLKNALNIYGISPLYFWNIGKNMSSSGAFQNNTSTALTSIFNVNGGNIIKNTTPAKDVSNNNLLFYVNQFSAGVWQSRTQLSSGNSITLASTTDGVRIGYGRSGSAGITMTQEDVDTYFSMKVFSTARYVKQFDTLSGTAFSENTIIGLWNISPDTFNSMTDRPDYVFGGGTFAVVPAGGFNLSRLQIIYDVVNKNAFTRYLSFSTTTNAYTAKDWKYINLSAIDNAVTIRSLATGTSLAENKDIGIYRVGSYAQSPQSDYVDMPVANFGGGTLEVIPSGSSNGIKQILTDVTNGNKYVRYISGSSLQTVGAWNADKGIKWAAIGDSITYGVYSTGSDTTAVNQNKCYIKRIADALGCETFTNLGVRGLGFVHAGNNSETLKDNVINATTWTDYNLVTIALGVNDYYGVSNIGTNESAAWDGTVYGNIRGAIEAINTANPKIKIIFITPFNMSKYGTSATHWAKDFSRNHVGKLKDVKNAIIYWCDFYGIEYINETDYSPINDLNITQYLLDGLHPSWDAHEMIARDLKNKIHFT